MSLPLSPSGRRYGSHKSVPDARDYGVARLLSRGSVEIPSEYSLEQYLGPVKDQQNLGACTAFAASGMLEFLFRKHDPNFTLNPEFAPVVSPLYIYYREREMDGVLAQGDTGSYGRTACKVLSKWGACAETEDPYAPSQFQIPPNPEQDSEAATMKSGAYHRIMTVDDMKHCIASDYVFIVGFDVRESFETKTGSTHVYDPHPSEPSLGGHEVLFHSFSDSKFGGSFKVRNSWGPNFADKGDFYFPYSVAASAILSDAFISHFGIWKPTAAVPHS